MSRDSKQRKYTSVREMAEKRGSGFAASYLRIPDKAQMFKPKSGAMLLDILPFVAGEGNPWASEGMMHWERTYHVHRGVGANSDTYLCPRMTSKSPCPICEYRAKLMKSGDDSKEDLIKDLAPKQRQLFNVINLKEPDKGVQIWDISYHLFGKALEAEVRNSDEEDGWDNFFSLNDGRTLKVGFAEKTFAGRTFQEVESIHFKTRNEEYDEDILEKVHALDEILIEPDYDDLKKAFLQTSDDTSSKKSKSKVDDDDEEDEIEDEEEEKPRKKKHAPVVEDDDDDDEEEEDEKPRVKTQAEEEDDDEEEEKPVKKKASKPPVDDDDDDDEPVKKASAKKPKDEDDWGDYDDDKEEEKPKKKKAK